MAETRELLFRFLGDTQSLDKASGRADKSFGKMEQSGKKTNRALGTMTKAIGALGLAIGAREVLRWANDAGKMADSAVLAADSLEKALGPAAQIFTSALEENRRIMGLNALEVDQLGGKLGLLLTGMGASTESAATLGAELVGIGGDLAAFRGELELAPQAVDAVTAALRGEFDPLEQWGVKLNEASIQAEIARRKGTDPLFASLTEGEQRLSAIVSLIKTQAAPAMGALEDASGSVAAKTNALAVETEDLQTELGAVVNEIKGPLIGALTGLLRGFVEGNKAIGRFIGENLAKLVYVIIPAVQAKFEELGAKVSAVFAAIGAAISTIFSPISRATNAVSGFIRKLSDIRIPSFSIPGFATGGTVGGARGVPQLAMVHGGETVTTANGAQRGDSGGSPGTVINVTVNAGLGNPQETARAIVDVLQIYNRTNGRIPIEIGGF